MYKVLGKRYFFLISWLNLSFTSLCNSRNYVHADICAVEKIKQPYQVKHCLDRVSINCKLQI